VLARTRLEYAQWLRAHGGASERARTTELAWGAIELAERAGMPWLSERARTLL